MVLHDIVKLSLQENQAEAEDAALFRSTVGEVNPLPDQNRIAQQKIVAHGSVMPSLTGFSLRQDRGDTIDSDFSVENAPEEFLRNGLSGKDLRRLRRCRVEGSIDLHGSNRDQARILLQEFLNDATRSGLRCVLVIHGKGRNSHGGEAVLRKLARHLLTRRQDVLAYCDALSGEGGSGAALVMLRAP